MCAGRTRAYAWLVLVVLWLLLLLGGRGRGGLGGAHDERGEGSGGWMQVCEEGGQKTRPRRLHASSLRVLLGYYSSDLH